MLCFTSTFAQAVISNIQMQGDDKLFLLADFDKTLTKPGKLNALIQVLYTQGYLTPAYQNEAQAQHDKYLPIEKDTTIPFSERVHAMECRRKEHKQLLIREGLTQQHILEAMKYEGIELREGYQHFFSLLHKRNIPLVILSAGGLGTLSIEAFLKHRNVFYDNIYIVGNEFIWDENGKAIAWQQPLIHALNKNAEIFKSLPNVSNAIQNRRNIILIGDGLGDSTMADGFDYDNLLKVGFRNQSPISQANLSTHQDTKLDPQEANFHKAYDIVVDERESLERICELFT